MIEMTSVKHIIFTNLKSNLKSKETPLSRFVFWLSRFTVDNINSFRIRVTPGVFTWLIWERTDWGVGLDSSIFNSIYFFFYQESLRQKIRYFTELWWIVNMNHYRELKMHRKIQTIIVYLEKKFGHVKQFMSS